MQRPKAFGAGHSGALDAAAKSNPTPGRAWSGDQDDAVDGAGGVGPRLLDLRQGDGPGADVEGAL